MYWQTGQRARLTRSDNSTAHGGSGFAGDKKLFGERVPLRAVCMGNRMILSGFCHEVVKVDERGGEGGASGEGGEGKGGRRSRSLMLMLNARSSRPSSHSPRSELRARAAHCETRDPVTTLECFIVWGKM